MWPWPNRGRYPEQTIALAGRLRAELDQVDEPLDGLLALARAQHGVLRPRRALTGRRHGR
jgi:hypothetical protein